MSDLFLIYFLTFFSAVYVNDKESEHGFIQSIQTLRKTLLGEEKKEKQVSEIVNQSCHL